MADSPRPFDKISGIVYVCDDDLATRKSIGLLLSSVNIKTVMCDSANDFMAKHDHDRPACLLLDIRMPGMSGLGLQRSLNLNSVEIPIIFLSAFGDPNTVIRAYEVGATGFICKPFSDTELIDKVLDCLQQDEQYFGKRRHRQQLQELWSRLSARETEIVQFLADGMSNKDIARQINVTVKTIEQHRANAMRRLQVNNFALLLKIYYSLNPEQRVITVFFVFTLNQYRFYCIVFVTPTIYYIHT